MLNKLNYFLLSTAFNNFVINFSEGHIENKVHHHHENTTEDDDPTIRNPTKKKNFNKMLPT